MHLSPARTFATPEWHDDPTAPADRVGRYGEDRRANPIGLSIVIALHVIAIAGVMMLDVIPITRQTREPTVVELIPEQVAPPPEPVQPPPTADKHPPPPAAAVVTPAPIVAVPVSVPLPLAAVRTAPPPEALPTPAPPAPGPVAAIVPPNGSAKSLGNPSPRYPTESRRKREEGVVRLRVVITADGHVRDISIARSSGFERLDDAALDTVRKWRFLPGTLAGAAVEAVGFLNIPFQIKA